MAAAVFATARCGDELDSLTVVPRDPVLHESLSALENRALKRLLSQSFGYLPVTATAALQARALVAHIGGLEKTRPESLSLEYLVAAGGVSPYAAASLAFHAAGALGWERRTLLLGCEGDYRWFVEVLTEDGRFLLDPYGGAFATAGEAFDAPLPYPEAFGGTWYASGQPAGFEDFLRGWRPVTDAAQAAYDDRYKGACVRAFYDAERAAELPVRLSLGAGGVTLGAPDGEPNDLALAVGGDEQAVELARWGGAWTPGGPYVGAYRLQLGSLTDGGRYRLRVGTLDEGPGYVVARPHGLELGAWTRAGEHEWALDVTAAAVSAELVVGMSATTYLALDWLAFEEAP